jgi:ATP adenylyltransferase
MTLDELLEFLRNGIRMSHIYQPVLIRSLLDNDGYCTLRQLALALLMQDESQIQYYERILKRMPLLVLKNRGVISVDKGIVCLQIDKLSLEEKAAIRLECDTLIQKFIQKKGLRIWTTA